MNVWGITHRGMVREQNQDAFACRTLPDGRIIALVCDGMGGARAGNVASTMAVDIIMDEFLAEEERSRTPERLKAAAASANRRIFQRAAGEERCAGMGTTLVAALADGEEALILNEGDSRAYHLSEEGGIVRVTRDHSLVEDMVEKGDLTPGQARSPPRRNLITRALGPDPAVEADGFPLQWKPGDFLLLCSDGLVNTVTDQEIMFEILHNGQPEDCLQRLMAISKQRGAPDNVTAILLMND